MIILYLYDVPVLDKSVGLPKVAVRRFHYLILNLPSQIYLGLFFINPVFKDPVFKEKFTLVLVCPLTFLSLGFCSCFS